MPLFRCRIPATPRMSTVAEVYPIRSRWTASWRAPSSFVRAEIPMKKWSAGLADVAAVDRARRGDRAGSGEEPGASAAAIAATSPCAARRSRPREDRRRAARQDRGVLDERGVGVGAGRRAAASSSRPQLLEGLAVALVLRRAPSRRPGSPRSTVVRPSAKFGAGGRTMARRNIGAEILDVELEEHHVAVAGRRTPCPPGGRAPSPWRRPSSRRRRGRRRRRSRP